MFTEMFTESLMRPGLDGHRGPMFTGFWTRTGVVEPIICLPSRVSGVRAPFLAPIFPSDSAKLSVKLTELRPSHPKCSQICSQNHPTRGKAFPESSH
jgi:hypothetical protein